MGDSNASRKSSSKANRQCSATTPEEWHRLEAQILSGLDIVEEYRALGVTFSRYGRTDQKAPCHAIGRKDRNASAVVFLTDKCGYYDSGDHTANCGTIWEFAARHGAFHDWREARQHFADKVGVPLPGNRNYDPVAAAKYKPSIKFLECPKSDYKLRTPIGHLARNATDLSFERTSSTSISHMPCNRRDQRILLWKSSLRFLMKNSLPGANGIASKSGFTSLDASSELVVEFWFRPPSSS